MTWGEPGLLDKLPLLALTGPRGFVNTKIDTLIDPDRRDTDTLGSVLPVSCSLIASAFEWLTFWIFLYFDDMERNYHKFIVIKTMKDN